MFKNNETKSNNELCKLRKGIKSIWFLKHPNPSLQSMKEHKFILTRYVPPLLF